ncbi:MAG: glycosyltransferase [Candidatus Zixiibacteriota bacterium]
MNVVVITHNYIRRQGDLTALYLHRLSSGLVKQGLHITVVCPHGPGLLKKDEIDGVNIIRFDYPFAKQKPLAYTGNMHEDVAASLFAKFVFLGFLNSFHSLASDVCRQVKPDVIWANWWIPPGLVAARIAKKFNLPLVISSHGTDIGLLAKPGISKKLGRFVYTRTTTATVVSTFLKERLLGNLDCIAPEQVSVLPMPVGMETFPKTDFIAKVRPMFLSVARYTKQKRLHDIVAAAEFLHKENLDFKIKMVGEGPLENEIRDSVVQKGMADKFEIGQLVAQQKLAELYRECDSVLLVSEGEGFGLVLVEAGLTGRPVIGSRSGGIVDFIEDNKNGLLIELGDVKTLAAHMRTIITETETKNRLGEAAYQTAINNFSTDVIVDRMHEIFMDAHKKGVARP